MVLLPPPPPRSMTTEDGTLSDRAYQWLSTVQQEAAATNLALAELAGQVDADGDTFSISYPENKTYSVMIDAPFGFTISSITSICASGTATATFKIGSTALGGGANSVSTSAQTKTHTTDNVVAAGDSLNCTISSVSSCDGAIFMIKFTRT